MQSRHSIKACAAAAVLATALVFAPSAAQAKDNLTFADALEASPALASGAQLAGASYTAPAVLVQAAPQLPPPTAGLPDPRPVWPGGPAATVMPPAMASAPQLDPRTRDAWLGECRRRMSYYYDGGYDRRHHRRHHDADRGGEVGYDYCESYLDDYYRYYSQAGYGFAHPGHGQMMMAPRMMMAPAPRPMASQGPCEEVVTEEYVPEPIRRPALRRAPARRVPDKRIRVY